MRASGLRKVLKDHEELALRYFWGEKAEDVSSKQVWTYVNEKLGMGMTISRATIFQFLKAMDALGILESTKVSGKGGHYPKYTARASTTTSGPYTSARQDTRHDNDAVQILDDLHGK